MGGIRVTLAEPDKRLFDWFVAVIVTFCGVEMLAGAEYKPLGVIVPTEGFAQVKVPPQVATLLAVNCCVWPP
jgi:hypothetical protein